jgi:serine/threonine-protein kinase RsbW
MSLMRNSPAADPSCRKCAEIRTTTEMNGLVAVILAEMAQAGFSEREQFGVRLSLEEAVVNGIKHGNREDPAKVVRIYYTVTTREVVTEIEDQGPGFSLNQVPNPLAPENIERPGGRGVFLMRHYMTSVQYNERGNRVMLSKVRGS